MKALFYKIYEEFHFKKSLKGTNTLGKLCWEVPIKEFGAGVT